MTPVASRPQNGASGLRTALMPGTRPELTRWPSTAKHRRQHDERAEGGEERHADARVGERLEEVDREHQHRRQGGRDGQCREGDRASGGGDRAGDGVRVLRRPRASSSRNRLTISSA